MNYLKELQPRYLLLLIKLILKLTPVVFMLALLNPATATATASLAHTIQSLQNSLAQANSQRGQLEQKLKTNETRSGQLHQQIRKLNQTLKINQASINKLGQQQQQLQQAIAQQQQQIMQTIKTAYIFHHEPLIKTLLNTESLEKTARMLTYTHRFDQARSAKIAQLQALSKQLGNNALRLKNEQQNIKTLTGDKTQQQRQLKIDQQHRQTLLTTINQAIHSNNSKLIVLKRNRSQLESAINQLNNQNKPQEDQQNFSARIGKLHWPIQGKIQAIFGTTIANSQLKWSGILIKAANGQAVHAVAFGKIIFARWLAGYGLLTIINHGNGYFTLYGRNQSLLKPVGSFVKAGEVIAQTGNSGGFKLPALYFAIRHNAKPLNPINWCR